MSNSTKMEGNDFIIFKHGCGNDSTYLKDPHNIDQMMGGMDFHEEGKERMKTPCENYTFYHIEVEYVGNQSYISKYEQSDDENETVEHPEGGFQIDA